MHMGVASPYFWLMLLSPSPSSSLWVVLFLPSFLCVLLFFSSSLVVWCCFAPPVL